jgi:methyl-accepting chemotaxis protein
VEQSQAQPAAPLAIEEAAMGTASIRARIRLAIGVLGMGYVALLLMVWWTGSQTLTHMEVSSGSLFPAALSSQEASAAFDKLTKRYSDAVLTQDKGALSQADETAQAVSKALESVRQHTAFDPERQRQVSDLIDRFASLASRCRSLYSVLIDSKTNVSSETQAQVAALAQDNKQMEASLQELRNTLSRDFQARLNSVTAETQRHRVLGLVFFLVVGSCAVVLTVMVERQVGTPLQGLTSRFRDIAEGEGDLTKRVEIDSKDEIGELAKWFDTFMDKLQTTIGQVATSTSGVAISAEELTALSQEMGSNAEETSAQSNVVSAAAEQVTKNLQTVATATEEMTSSIKEIAKNANEAARVATSAVKTAQNTNTTVAKLGQASNEIGQVIKVITSIAQQTNLLALNATIEAARAGEAGKGFAVVANEVKELAKETAKATEDITQKIEGIQGDTKGAVEAIGQITTIINQVNDISNTIASAVEEQTATTNEIARNVGEAAKGSSQIAENIVSVATAAKGTTEGTTNTQKAAQELARMAAELQRLVGQFKFDGSTGGAGASEPRTTAKLARDSYLASRAKSQPGATARLH